MTSIGNDAFTNCNFTSVTIPDGITSLSTGIFKSCASLTSITIPDSVTSIGGYAFAYCSSLTSITLPINPLFTSIGDNVFLFCSSLTSINIPDSVTSIGSFAFAVCTSLATVNCLATTAPTLGSRAFYGISATEIHVPVGATGYTSTYGGLTVVFDL